MTTTRRPGSEARSAAVAGADCLQERAMEDRWSAAGERRTRESDAGSEKMYENGGM